MVTWVDIYTNLFQIFVGRTAIHALPHLNLHSLPMRIVLFSLLTWLNLSMPCKPTRKGRKYIQQRRNISSLCELKRYATKTLRKPSARRKTALHTIFGPHACLKMTMVCIWRTKIGTVKSQGMTKRTVLFPTGKSWKI